LAYEIQKTLEELQDKGEHLDDLLAQASPEMFDGIGVEIQRFGADIMGKASSFLQQFQGDNYINESQLRNIIKESIKKVLLKESERHEIFTLNIFDVEDEEGIDDMQYARDYESEEEAIQAAREVAQKYADDDSVINVFVMAGEYMDEQGNVFGEPDAIYCVSNKDERTTMIARKNAGYSNLGVDEYIG